MAGIGNLSGLNSCRAQAAGGSSQPPAAASGELAKLETQLSDWVHCPSSKTSAGKAKIAEITDKIDGIKVKVKKAEDDKARSPTSIEATQPARPAAQNLRFDGQGVWLSMQA